MNPKPAAGHADQIARTAVLLATLGGLGFLLSITWHLCIAAFYGASANLDAFWIGLAIPKAVADFVHIGILTLLFIVIFNQPEHKIDASSRWRVVSSILNLVLLGTAAVILLLLTTAPWLVKLMGPGLDPETQALSARILRLLSLLLVPTALVGVLGGVLNAQQNFFPFALSRVVGLALQIGALLALTAAIGVHALPSAMILGTIGMLLVCAMAIRKSTVRYHRGVEFRSEPARLALRFFAALGCATILMVLNQMSDRFFASLLDPGSISALEFAWRFEIPVSQIMGLAVGLPAFALLAMQASDGRMGEFRDTLATSVRLLALLVIPLIGFLMLFREPVAQLWFQRGAFSADSARLVSSLLPFLGVIFFGRAMALLLVFGMLAIRKIKPLLGILLLEVLANTVANALLMKPLGLRGIALATLLAMAVSNIWLWTILLREIGGLSFRSFLTRAWKVALANGMALGALAILHLTLWESIVVEGPLATPLKLAAAGLVLVVIYGLVCHTVGLIEIRKSGALPRLRLKAREWNPLPRSDKVG